MTISNYLQYNNPIRIIWRAGTVEDPYVDISESWRIINDKIVLTEIPDEFYRVRITNYIEVLDKNKILSSNEFRVNYQNSIIEFNPTEENKTVQVIYKGRGQILYPASRIYTNNDNPNIIQTLQDIVDTHRDVIDTEAQLQQIKNDADIATNNAQAVADNTKHLGDYNSTTTYVENNIVSYNGSSYINILTCTNILPTNATYWKLIAEKGEQGIQGIQGEQGIQGVQGEKGLNWRGGYISTTSYVIDDAITFQGSSYICISPSVNNQPNISPSYWDVLAEKGQDGLGSGDMNKSVYDTDGDGVVDLAEDSLKLGGQSPEYYAPQSDVDNKIGILTNLQTTEKTNLVGAINEINTELNLPEYSSLLIQNSSIFSTGTGKLADGTDVTTPLKVVEGQISDIGVKGRTVSNIVKNGNFANGTTDWLAYNSTNTATNNTLSNTGNGTANNPYSYQSMNLILEHKYYVIAKVRVTNSSSSQIYMQLGGTTVSQLSPTINQWYTLKGVITYTSGLNGIMLRHIYADVTTANGKVMEVQEVMAIDLTAIGETETDVNKLAQKYPYITGTKSTVNSKVVSRSKNKFDGELVRNESYSGTTGAIAVVSGYSRNKNRYIKLPNDTTKVIVSNNFSPIRSIIYWYDINKTFLSTTDITSQNAEHIKPTNAVFYNFSIATIDSAFIIWNSMNFITTYEPYKDSPTEINWTDGEGRSLPNGINDEIKDGKEYKRTNKYTLQSSNITSLDTTSFSNFDLVVFRLPTTDYYDSNGMQSDAILIPNFSALMSPLTDTIDNINKVAWGDYFISLPDGFLIVAKGTYATLTDAQTKLAGTSVIYQLANEVVKDAIGLVPITAFKDGDMYIEPQIEGTETTVPTFEYKVPLNRAGQIDSMQSSLTFISGDYASKNQEGWIEPVLLNGWVNYGGSNENVGYYKDEFGIVHLKGTIKGGTSTAWTALFNLPTGYRPFLQRRFSVDGNNAYAMISITASTGAVNIVVGNSTQLSLDGISFKAEK